MKKKLLKELEKAFNVETIFNDMRDIVEDKIADMQDTFDDRSEKWQESEKGYEFQEKISEMEDFSLEIENKWDELSQLLYDFESDIEYNENL